MSSRISNTTVESKRGNAKRRAIVAAATSVFLDQGYEATSMDAIAANANVSKRTVYNHFPSKRDLFRVVTQRLYAGLLETDVLLESADEAPETALPRLAQSILKHLRQTEIQGLLRLVIAEQQRIPELSAEFHGVGKGPAVGLVEQYFQTAHERGQLQVPEPLLAAQQFLGAVKESLFWPAMLGMTPSKTEDAVINAATAMILHTYAHSGDR
jgi:TetR/AcrR family transcriptional regulator of autoinduction and epiphytic fitness